MDILDLIAVNVRLLILERIVYQYVHVTAVMTYNVTTYMDAQKQKVRRCFEGHFETNSYQFHSSLELIGPVFYDTLNK